DPGGPLRHPDRQRSAGSAREGRCGDGGTARLLVRVRTEGTLPIEHLGAEAAELLSLTNGSEARSLNRLAELAAWQVPACAGAHAAVWRDGEVIGAAATHPDLAELADLQLDLGRGPLVAAADEGLPVSCPDTLAETRWPEYAAAALRRSVRCSVHLVREFPRGALVLSLFGVRPGVLDVQSNPMADKIG